MTYVRSTQNELYTQVKRIPSLGKHPNNLMSYKIILSTCEIGDYPQLQRLKEV